MKISLGKESAEYVETEEVTAEEIVIEFES